MQCCFRCYSGSVRYRRTADGYLLFDKYRQQGELYRQPSGSVCAYRDFQSNHTNVSWDFYDGNAAFGGAESNLYQYRKVGRDEDCLENRHRGS